ncbi:40 kDa protein [Garlic virus D]|uniref:40 kDa protein n=1 Tax=Garlic virus D TaxID=12430 RepID=O55605_9VIRU|nr:40 kDa protein [Garlic virus D]AHA93788.1 40 kDa protein [Garlic virus D]BAA61824.1 40kDa protein [Garlic virus D]
MVIVTTFHIDRARELIITNTNSCRDTVLNQLQALGVELQTTTARLDNFYSATTTSWQLIRDRLCDTSSSSNANLDTAPAEARSEPPNAHITNLQRTFFSNANIALDATRTLLGYVPPARYDVPPVTLPLDELFGQLHALHQNSLEWLTHINHNVDSILDMLNPSNLLSQGTPLNRLREMLVALTGKVDDIYATIQSSRLETNQPSSSKPVNRFETIEHSLESLHIKLDELTSAVAHALDHPHVTPVPDEMRPSASTRDLPAYQAQHPTRPCRAYGTVLFEDKILRIPMDITGRPVSTALKLELHLTTNDQTTMVSYRIYDDGYLLLSDDVETAHKLQHRLSDCLALLHQRCPNFIYKIKGHGLC